MVEFPSYAADLDCYGSAEYREAMKLRAGRSLWDTAITEGQGINELAKAIDDQFDVDSRVRSKLIARTELTDSINDGTLRMLIREGYTQKEWSTVADGRERPTHAWG